MISTWDFLTIMDAVHTFSITTTSFATAYAALTDWMTHTKDAMAQTNAILAQNQAIHMQIQSHMGLHAISPYVFAQAVSALTPVGPVPPSPPAPTSSLAVLAVVAVATTPPTEPQPVQTEDTSSPAIDLGGSTSSIAFPSHTPLRSMAHLVGGRVSEGSDFYTVDISWFYNF